MRLFQLQLVFWAKIVRKSFGVYSAIQINQTSLERAFILARSGNCERVTDIVRILKNEGYYQDQAQGMTLKKQLTALIREARKPD